jgi:UDP-glucose:glycoprotein glucosyltransferase
MLVKGTAALFSAKGDVSAAALFSADILPERKEGKEVADDVVLTVMVDPLSIAGQRAAAVVRLALDHLHLPVHLVLVPPFELSEFPLKNFYRFVANPSLDHYVQASAGEGGTDGAAVVPTSLQAQFHRLPRSHIFTARLDVPESWNVQTASSPQDMDNLVCDAKSCGDAPKSDLSTITYSLKSLLVTGQCFEKQSEGRMSPPNGLQLTLDSKNIFFHENAPAQHADTLVMQNLGYFQLQASNPGLFVLRLADGKARNLFLMDGESFQGKHLAQKDDASFLGFTVAVKSFSDLLLQVRVHKRPGFEHIPLLDDPEESKQTKTAPGVGDVWSSISGLFSGSKGSKTKASTALTASEDETIHVFSLATGHVYERLLRIMMLSVSKRTKSPLKFWLFENYLSPTFKKLAEAMAQQYGFQVGYVTYKWPKWLTKQTEKQRIIWGYKILFLDVLFPLNVKKVIYVDADQVVRADLKELWDMDIEGKPYGYVPFCSSRKETLGFQFWRSGYWESHLQGRPYHISALYVVDLTVFRYEL